jgi:HSP20 family protein
MLERKEENRNPMTTRQRGGAIERRGDWSPFSSSEMFNLSPFSLMKRMSDEMDRIFSGRSSVTGWAPPIEMYEKEGKLVVCAELPGLEKDDVKIEATEDGLLIEGERKQEHEGTTGGWRHSERSYGHFQRFVSLPEGAEIDHANAEFRNGVLTVNIPMSQKEQHNRQIPIGTGEPQKERQASSTQGSTSKSQR